MKVLIDECLRHHSQSSSRDKTAASADKAPLQNDSCACTNRAVARSVEGACPLNCNAVSSHGDANRRSTRASMEVCRFHEPHSPYRRKRVRRPFRHTQIAKKCQNHPSLGRGMRSVGEIAAKRRTTGRSCISDQNRSSLKSAQPFKASPPASVRGVEYPSNRLALVASLTRYAPGCYRSTSRNRPSFAWTRHSGANKRDLFARHTRRSAAGWRASKRSYLDSNRLKLRALHNP